QCRYRCTCSGGRWRYRWSPPRRDSQPAATPPLPEEGCIGGSLRRACESRRPLQSWGVPWLLSLSLSLSLSFFVWHDVRVSTVSPVSGIIGPAFAVPQTRSGGHGY